MLARFPRRCRGRQRPGVEPEHGGGGRDRTRRPSAGSSTRLGRDEQSEDGHGREIPRMAQSVTVALASLRPTFRRRGHHPTLARARFPPSSRRPGWRLAGAALAKLAAPGHSRDALATFGLSAAHAGRSTGSDRVSRAGAGGRRDRGAPPRLCRRGPPALLRRGAHVGAPPRSSRRPVRVLGPRSRVGPAAVVRDLVLAGGFAAILLLPHDQAGTEEWLEAGLGVALLGWPLSQWPCWHWRARSASWLALGPSGAGDSR